MAFMPCYAQALNRVLDMQLEVDFHIGIDEFDHFIIINDFIRIRDRSHFFDFDHFYNFVQHFDDLIHHFNKVGFDFDKVSVNFNEIILDQLDNICHDNFVD